MRPMRRIFRERPVVVVLGPPGSGRSTVADRIAGSHGKKVRSMSSKDLEDALHEAVGNGGAWPLAVLNAEVLVLDGPQNLRPRIGARRMLVDLIRRRTDVGRRTVICQATKDPSAEFLLDYLPEDPGSRAVLILRFPASRSGRMRFARRVCDQLGLPRSAAQGTDALEPWSYDGVIASLEALSAAEGAG